MTYRGSQIVILENRARAQSGVCNPPMTLRSQSVTSNPKNPPLVPRGRPRSRVATCGRPFERRHFQARHRGQSPHRHGRHRWANERGSRCSRCFSPTSMTTASCAGSGTTSPSASILATCAVMASAISLSTARRDLATATHPARSGTVAPKLVARPFDENRVSALHPTTSTIVVACGANDALALRAFRRTSPRS